MINLDTWNLSDNVWINMIVKYSVHSKFGCYFSKTFAPLPLDITKIINTIEFTKCNSCSYSSNYRDHN